MTCARHWFAYYGYVGSSSPICRKCGAPNPNYDHSRDPFPDDSSIGAEEPR